MAFLIFGGNDHDVAALRKISKPRNFYLKGYLTPAKVPEIMAAMDLLVMPYQRSVSIGVKADDTGRWMSPMKMFEYMATGVPFIASDLPTLREVLRDRQNCLLAKPDDPVHWSNCLRLLLDKPELGEAISTQAHVEYRNHYTWTRRAKAMLDAITS